MLKYLKLNRTLCMSLRIYFDKIKSLGLILYLYYYSIILEYINLQGTHVGCDVCEVVVVFGSWWKATPVSLWGLSGFEVFLDKYSLWSTCSYCGASPWLPVSCTINTSLWNGSCSHTALVHSPVPRKHSAHFPLTLSHSGLQPLPIRKKN